MQPTSRQASLGRIILLAGLILLSACTFLTGCGTDVYHPSGHDRAASHEEDFDTWIGALCSLAAYTHGRWYGKDTDVGGSIQYLDQTRCMDICKCQRNYDVPITSGTPYPRGDDEDTQWGDVPKYLMRIGARLKRLNDGRNMGECDIYKVPYGSSHVIVVAFRGTDGYEEIPYDMYGYPENVDELKAAFLVGPVDYSNRYFDRIVDVIRADGGRAHHIVITGHSLGGAVAEITAYRLTSRGLVRPDRDRIVTFGQIRAGISREWITSHAGFQCFHPIEWHTPYWWVRLADQVISSEVPSHQGWLGGGYLRYVHDGRYKEGEDQARLVPECHSSAKYRGIGQQRGYHIQNNVNPILIRVPNEYGYCTDSSGGLGNHGMTAYLANIYCMKASFLRRIRTDVNYTLFTTPGHKIAAWNLTGREMTYTEHHEVSWTHAFPAADNDEPQIETRDRAGTIRANRAATPEDPPTVLAELPRNMIAELTTFMTTSASIITGGVPIVFRFLNKGNRLHYGERLFYDLSERIPPTADFDLYVLNTLMWYGEFYPTNDAPRSWLNYNDRRSSLALALPFSHARAKNEIREDGDGWIYANRFEGGPYERNTSYLAFVRKGAAPPPVPPADY